MDAFKPTPQKSNPRQRWGPQCDTEVCAPLHRLNMGPRFSPSPSPGRPAVFHLHRKWPGGPVPQDLPGFLGSHQICAESQCLWAATRPPTPCNPSDEDMLPGVPTPVVILPFPPPACYKGFHSTEWESAPDDANLMGMILFQVAVRRRWEGNGLRIPSRPAECLCSWR